MGFIPLRKDYFWATSHFMQNYVENFYAERGQWLDYLVERRDLTHGDFRVAYFIASKINPKDKAMWWAVSTIAAELGVSLATVTRATARLSEKGLLVISKMRKGAHSYSIRMPFDPAAEAHKFRPLSKKKTGGRVSKTETVWVSKTENKSNKA